MNSGTSKLKNLKQIMAMVSASDTSVIL